MSYLSLDADMFASERWILLSGIAERMRRFPPPSPQKDGLAKMILQIVKPSNEARYTNAAEGAAWLRGGPQELIYCPNRGPRKKTSSRIFEPSAMR